MRLEDARRAFAEEIGAVAHLESPALVEAFARVPREAFLGPGPWQIVRSFDRERPYRTTIDADPRHIHHDVLVGIDPARHLNNGQPSALARWIQAADILPGDRILHIGCGTGYYTAIMAELAAPAGRVVAWEVDADLAARARAALAPWAAIDVQTGDASAPGGPFDVIFVNAGATHARPEWLAALAAGGRLLLPLTIHPPQAEVVHGIGIMLRIERREGRWPAAIVSDIGIYDCANARDPANEAALMALAGSGAARRIRAVAIDPHDRGDACLAHMDGFCLQAES